MNKRIVRVPIESIGDVYGYSMIEYHMEFTKVINKLLKSNKINFRLYFLPPPFEDETLEISF